MEVEEKERARLGDIGRARRGLAAIEALADIRAGARTMATEPERVKLSGWPGWGPMSKAFDPPNETWAGIGERLRELLPEADLKVAIRGTYNAFFTPQPVVDAMWELAAAFGFNGGLVAELGCGAGGFLASAPDSAVVTGVERDPTSAAIAALLNPSATIINRPLQATPLHSGFSLVIGNVPFGDVPVFDPAIKEGHAVLGSLHSYFMYRGLKALAPGGYLMVLTSRFVMDAREYKQRQELSELADFVGAIRLPNGGLDGEEGEGGTKACADIVILRRKDDDDDRMRGHLWKDTDHSRFGWSNPLNCWWDEHPEMVLGEMVAGSTSMYGLGVLVKPHTDTPLPDQIRKAGRRLVKMSRERKILLSTPVRPEEFDPLDQNVVSEEGWLENSFHLVDGQVLVVVNGRAQPKPRPGKELVALIKLRDLVKALLDAEADHKRSDASIEPLRRDVRTAWQRYVREYKPLNWCNYVEMGVDEETGLAKISRRAPTRGGFRHDPDWHTVAAIEDYDEETRTAKPAPILLARQNRPVVRPTRAATPAEALALCLDYRGGRVDLGLIGQLLYGIGNADQDVVAAELGDAVFQQPGDGRWVTAEEYLSGNVRAKHRAAETAAKHDERYRRNADALEKVLPTWLGPGQIRASLGAVWIPPKDVAQFLIDLLESGATVRRILESNKWEIEGGLRVSTVATAVWGTAHYDGYRLVELALNGEKPVVRRTVENEDGTKSTFRDDDATLQACEVQQRIKNRFAEWVWEDPDRCERLVNKYNTTFNCLVARKFNGDHITFEGLAPEWAKKVYSHQRGFVARAMATPAVLCGLPVGSGKTFMMVASAMSLGRAGLVNKPMLVVPNHLLDQVDREARQMYPAARILTASAETISDNRRAFTARVTMSSWDLIIITQSAFNAMPVHSETEREYLEGKTDAVHESIIRSAPRGKMSRATKNIAKKLDRVEAKVKTLRHLARGRDAGCTFEQLGVDWVGIDEAHAYKNLDVECRNEGFNIRGSKRATDLDVKLRWLKGRREGGRYAALFTGTPISNSMLELFVFMRYTMPDYLASLDLGSADAWVSTFVEMVTKVGVSINGADFELQTKPARFINAPELRVQLSLAADIQTAEMLGLARPKAIERTIAIDPTSAQEQFAEELVERARRLKGVRFPGKGADNMLRVCTHGRWMATDPVLVGLVDNERGKLDHVAANMLEMWREHPDKLQIGFLDIGTPNDKVGTQSYGRLRRMLTDGGMPVDRIRFVHDAKTDAAKAKLFADCKAGKVSVILGSTEKLGTGTNIQNLVVAMHHIDAPYTPSGVEQRNGRGLRPGNVNEQVYVFVYVTKRTFDAYLWQLLVRKLGFISQMMSGNLDRTIEDCETDQLMSFEAVQAAATDQPLLLEKADVAVTVAQLEGLRRAHMGMIARTRRDAPKHRAEADFKAAHAAAWEALVAADAQITDEVAEELHAAMGRASKYGPPVVQVGAARIAMRTWDLIGKETTRHPLPTIDTGMGEIEIPKIYNWTKPEQLRKVIVAVLDGAAEAAAALRQSEAKYRAEAAAAEDAAKQPFEHDAELTAARARLDQIEAALREAVNGDRAKDTDVVVEETAAAPDLVISTVPGSIAQQVKVAVPATVPAAIVEAVAAAEEQAEEQAAEQAEVLDFSMLDFSILDRFKSDAEAQLAKDMEVVFGDLFA